MILYLDTSALVKLYVDESGSFEVLTAAEAADSLVTNQLSFVEFRSALSRRLRERFLDDRAFGAIIRAFAVDWETLLLISTAMPLIRDAARLAEQYRLRAYDAVHLASALAVAAERPDVTFASWDRALAGAAREAGLRTLPSA